jgi:DNA invertase Pin-like site-specific DNA recombinase
VVNVAIYVRLSDEDKDKQHESDESESIINQKAMLSDYCKERNWDIFDIYCDEDYSGADINRPDFNRMIDDCKNGYINIVLCKSQSRFSRDMEVIEKYIHGRFTEWNVRFIGVIDRADSYDKGNKKARQINGLIDQWYLEDISENTRKTLRSKKLRGEYTGAFAPYGYIRDPENKNRLIIDEYAAQIVKGIFEWYLQGWGYRKIAMTLNEQGILTPSFYKQQQGSKYENSCANRGNASGIWTNQAIFKMIRNETYTGTLVQGKVQNISYKDKKQKNVPKKDWIRVPNCHEPVISEQTWERVLKKLGEKTKAGKITKEIWSLSAKVRCALCGTIMKRSVYYNKARTIKYYNLVCNAYVNGTLTCPNVSVISGLHLENAIIEQTNEWIRNYCEQDKISIKCERDSKLVRLKTESDSICTEITKIDDIVNELYEDKLNGIVPKERYVNLSQKYEKKIMTLKERLTYIERQRDSIKQTELDSAHRKQLIEKYTCIDKLTRPIVDEFIDTVCIGEKTANHEREVIVHWNF